MCKRMAVALCMLLFSISANAEVLSPIESIDARVLANIDELARSDSIVIYSSPVVEGECWGTVDSCPDVRLFVVILPEALYQDPCVFQLPSAKEWEFIRWNGNRSFTVKTSIPTHNIEPKERSGWEPTEFNVSIGDGVLSY